MKCPRNRVNSSLVGGGFEDLLHPLLGEDGVHHGEEGLAVARVEVFEKTEPLGKLLVLEADLFESLRVLGDELVDGDAEGAGGLDHELLPARPCWSIFRPTAPTRSASSALPRR